MRIPKFSMLFISAIVLTMSCNKDSESNSLQDDSQTDGTDSENSETGKSETANADKEKAQQLYADYYLASQSSNTDISWTGNVPECQPGTVPQETLDKIFLRILYYRNAVGLNNDISNDTTKSEKAQKAALMMHANGALDHFPPDDWKCFSTDGKEGAASSLLTSTKNAAAIDSYIQDQGDENYPAGHRRWLLWPRLQEIGVGNTSSYNAIWVLGNPGTSPEDAPEFIAWPPAGYLPKTLAYNRWSFSIAQADFADTKISMKIKDGENISLEIEELTGIYGDNTIVWRPDINVNILTEDTTYIVTLSGVNIDGERNDFKYEVVLFDVTQ